MRQTFVHTAEVIPVLPHTSSALSSPPFAQLAVGSRPQAINPFDNKVSHSFIIYQLSIKFHKLPFQHTAVGTITFFLKIKSSHNPYKSPKCSQPSHLFFSSIANNAYTDMLASCFWCLVTLSLTKCVAMGKSKIPIRNTKMERHT